MRRNFTMLALVLSLFLVTTSLFSAGIDLTGVGSRAQTLGGNFRAVANDWSAIHWNPAGMVFTNGFTAGMSSEFISVNVGYTADHFPIQGVDHQFSTTVDEEVNNEPKTFFVPAGGIYYSTGKYAFGLGVWAPFGLGAKWDLLHTQSYNKAYPEFDYDDNLQVVDIHPTFSYKINDKLSVGLGASIIMADIIIQKPNFTPNPYLFQASLATIKGALEQYQTGGLNSQFNHLLTDTKLEGDGTGFGFNFGVMYKPTEDLSIGASMQFYNDIKLDGTVNGTVYFADNQAANQVIQGALADTSTHFQAQLQQMLALGYIDQEAYGVITNYYSGGSFKKYDDVKVTAEMPLPMRVGIGICYTGVPNLQISADLAWTQWSAWDVIKINKENGDELSALVENWEDGIRMGLGLEYTLPMVTLRGGYYTEPNAAVAETMSPTIPDFSRRHSIAIGAMIPLGPVNLEASYEKILVGDKEILDWQPTLDEAGSVTGYDNMAGSYTMGINCFMLGLDYKF